MLGLAVTSAHSLKVEGLFGGLPPSVEVSPHKMREGRYSGTGTRIRLRGLCRGTCVLVAPPAVKVRAQVRAPAFLGDDPRSQLPRRAMADVLAVTARQLGHPVVMLVLVEACDGALHHPAIPQAASD